MRDNFFLHSPLLFSVEVAENLIRRRTMNYHGLSACGIVLVCLHRVSSVPPGNLNDWELSLAEEFDAFNTSLWTKGWSWYDGKGNPLPRNHTKASDTCWFDDNNVFVRNGSLVLVNKRENNHGFNYSSGVVNSIAYNRSQGFQQTYGYFEARIRPSPGATNCGMCPAFWMPNVLNAGDNGHCEIDVMEIPGNKRFGGGHTMYGTVHTLDDHYDHGSAHGNVTLSGYFSDEYHNFAVLWEPGVLAWYYDDKEFFRTDKYVPSTAAYLVLDNEVGLGHLDPVGDGGWAGDPSHTPFPQEMLIDHVKVWRKKSYPIHRSE